MGRAAADLSCPFCDSQDVECVSQWGAQILTSQWRCRGCGTYFEAVRDEFAADADRSQAAGTGWDS